MTTTFRFSAEQLASLDLLRSQARISGSYVAAYQYILDVLDPPGPGINPRDSADAGLSYSWFVGARQVNEGTGPFATLIIEYTQRQAELRYGAAFTQAQMQNASNQVADRVLTEIINPTNQVNTGLLPDIAQIAEFDARTVAQALFSNDQNDTAYQNSAAWPGAVLFPLLGSDQSWRLLGAPGDGALNTVDDLKNVLFAYDSLKQAWGQFSQDDVIALAPVLGDIGVQALEHLARGNPADFTNLWDVAGGSSAAAAALRLVYEQDPSHVLDMLRSAYEGQPLTGTNGQTFAGHAHSFFSTLGNDAQAIGLRQLDYYDAAALAGLAKGGGELGLATLNALKSLSIFALTGLDYGSRNANGELAVYDSATGQGELTQEWLADRAEFLWAKAHTDAENVVHVPGLLRTLYDQKGDAGSAQHVYEIGKDAASLALPVKIIAFGDDAAADILGGDVKDDRLYGMGGGDTLSGNAGNDYLEGNRGDDTLNGGQGRDELLGGTGNDTYRLQTTGGVDTILDHSGVDQIQIGGAAVSGEFRPAVEGGQIYYSADSAYELRPLLGGEWRVSARDVGGEYTAVADVGGWREGEFGVTLGAAAPVDRVPLSLPVSTHYLHMNGSAVPAPKGAQFDGGSKSDSFYGSNQDDVVSTGGGSSNYVINANGGDDKVQGGDGQDFVRTGSPASAAASDNDLAFGGAKSDVLLGGYGSDQLWGDAADGWQAAGADSGGRGDWLGGEGGNDSLHGSRAGDAAFGGAGEDLLQGGAGGDLLLGDAQYAPNPGVQSMSYMASLTDSYRWDAATAGMVRLPAGSYSSDPVKTASPNAFSWVWSVAGDDYSLSTPAGFASQNRLAAGGGGDLLDGGPGDDWMAGQAGGDYLEGGEGDDILYGDDVDGLMAAADQGNDALLGGAGSDRLFGGGGDDRLEGGAGDDTLSGGGGEDTYVFNRGDGRDTVADPGQDSALLFGPGIGPGDITLRLGSLALDLGGGDEVHIAGFDANDVFNSAGLGLIGFADGTVLSSAELLARGFDLAGTAAADQLAGTNTVDRIQGLAGNDTLAGGGGDDTLDGGAGNDTLNGGTGVDAADYSTASASVRVNLGLASPQNTFGSGYDTLAAIENLTGSNFNDYLVGGIKADNVLTGGLGADSLFGKTGADRFVLNRLEDSGVTPPTRDTILDFKEVESDKIDLSHLDADSAKAGRQAFNSVISSAFDTADATGRLVFDAASHVLYGSTDSDNAPEFSIALTGVNSLAATSLILA